MSLTHFRFCVALTAFSPVYLKYSDNMLLNTMKERNPHQITSSINKSYANSTHFNSASDPRLILMPVLSPILNPRYAHGPNLDQQ